MNFNELLKRWNKGILKGAAVRFAEHVGVSQMTVSRWATGGSRVDEPMQSKVAKALGVSVDQLMACFPQRTSPSAESSRDYAPFQEVSISYVPVVGTVSAETFNCVFEDDITPMEVLPVPMTRGTKAKALRVRGACMEPAASDGDYVVVAAKAAYEDGSLVVAKVDGECTLKRVYFRNDKALLIPDNKKYKRLEVKKEALQIVGVVVYILRRPELKKL
jgi:repressor LexA